MPKKPIVETPVNEITGFIQNITLFASAQNQLKCYRGQQNVTWEPVPSLFRNNLVGLEKQEKIAIRDLESVRPNEFSNDSTMLDKLVRMQHFGLPTQLMDVSVNPLVALYFATEEDKALDLIDGMVVAFSVPSEREKYFDSDSVSCIANLANMTSAEKRDIIRLRGSRVQKIPTKDGKDRINNDPVIKRLHQFIKEEKPYFLPIIHPVDLLKPYYVHPKMSNRWIIAQSGAFIIHGLTPPVAINFRQK